MTKVWLYVLIVSVIVILIYLLWRLNRLENLVRHYKLKNQEGVGAWTRTRNPLFLVLAFFQGIYCLADWINTGFEPSDAYRFLLLVGLPLYLYFRDDT
ncbi:hypothetical protein [Streptococcus moroccensis]|uniref:Protein-S-isoprenylcysteine O-methyltransferase Ste14 n=1 Tax=Streptococcus moroccensis TaxID=1451356 RepID=A0ABT9YQA7_9STRE|nr:hypothetical protein [Streptococcus moroccensis]MDQ0221508.1 protein-S-isoprenylcysteine O-methyltransferase Ste14 [Streptococcus moroccensis]